MLVRRGLDDFLVRCVVFGVLEGAYTVVRAWRFEGIC